MKRLFAKHSIGATLIRLLSGMLFLFSLVAFSSLESLVNSLDDAEAVNVAGSLRMQSYRLAYTMENNAHEIEDKVALFEQSLASAALSKVKNQTEELSLAYQNILQRWQELKPLVLHLKQEQYQAALINFVDQIDQFVEQTQHHAERKVYKLTLIQVFAFIIISALAIYSLWYVRRYVVNPIYHLVSAAQQIQTGNFKLKLKQNRPASRELTTLSLALQSMSDELQKHYQSLENIVQDKTAKLTQANQDLQCLFQLEQLLFNEKLTQHNLTQALDLIRNTLNLSYTELQLDTSKQQLTSGERNQAELTIIPLTLATEHYGELRLVMPAEKQQALVMSFSRTLSKVLRYEKIQLQQQKLLLMEERATIARELHDSLAQSLSYLKIQTALLQRELSLNPNSAAQAFASEIQTALNDAYVQLRELLTTFRLSIKHAQLNESLAVLVEGLNQQHPQQIEFISTLKHDNLTADRQIHIIQIVREAIINALKHADCELITVNCLEQRDGLLIQIIDDGQSGHRLEQVNDHYGLQIMRERSERLAGQLQFIASPTGGVLVQLTLPTSQESFSNE